MNIKKILAFALGPIASAAFGLITVPVVAWAFSPEDVGRLNILQVTLSFCLLLGVLGLDQAYVREFHESPDRARLLKACFTPGFSLLIVGGALAIAFDRELSQLLYGTANPIFFWITLASVMITFISRFLSLILRMQERGLAFSMSQIIPKALQLLLIISVVVFNFERNFTIILWITIASSSAVLIIYAWNTKSQWIPAIRSQPSTQQKRSLLKFGFPLIFSGLAYWGLTATSTFVLRSHSTLGEIGIYSVTSSFAGAAAIFQSIFTVVWAPTVYKWISEGVDMARVDSIAKKALAAVCAIFIAIGSLSWVIDYFLPPHYANVKYLVVCAIAPALLYTLSEITCVGIGIMRRTTLTVWITLLALLTNVVICLWLASRHGAAGAVIANAVGYLVFFIARTEASSFVWRRFPRTRMYFFTSFSVAFSIATAAFGSMLPIHYAFMWLAFSPVVGWYFRMELIEFFTAIRKAWGQRVEIRSKT